MPTDICGAYLEIQHWQNVADLEKCFDTVFDSDEATGVEKRLRKGRHGRIFKLFGEEVQPLIWWCKATEEFNYVKFFVGNEHFDAKVRNGTSEVQKVEIGLAVDGYFERLLNEFLSTTGIASPFAKYRRVGRGKTKTVEEASGAEMRSESEIIERYFRLIQKVMKNKSSNSNYDPNTVLIISFREMLPISEPFQKDFCNLCLGEIDQYDWGLSRVDIVGSKTGVICSKIVR